MKRFELINEGQKIIFKFPTSLDEITEDYLKLVTSNIVVADNYTLVGVVYHETLGRLILARKQNKKGFSAGVVPVFIKAGHTENTFIKSISIKDKLIIPSQSLALANHVVSPYNVLSLDKFYKYLDRDTSIAFRYANNYGNEQCYFVEFKAVPNCEIVSYYNKETEKALKGFNSKYLAICDTDAEESSSGNSESSSNS